MKQFARIYSRACQGLEAVEVKVEVYITPGFPKISIVGLPKTVVKESGYRVRAAISQNGFTFPMRQIIVNLAPADVPKEGGCFDLPIALGVLVASRQLPADPLEGYEFISELSLSGSLLSVKGLIPTILAASKSKRKIIIPKANLTEAQLTQMPNIFYADHLMEVCNWVIGKQQLPEAKPTVIEQINRETIDMSDVRGQHHAARAMEICAAGRHHCLMLGAPGSGKTMLANRLRTILPPMTQEEALTSASIMSLSPQPSDIQNFYQRAFRAPHHTASSVALVGGGSTPQPGEISKAHNGILFLDELPEFQRKALDALREPLETGTVHISRAAYSVEFPSRFQLIAAMNPCPDGMDVDGHGRCPCDESKLNRYYARISAPMLDRFDMHVRVPRIKWGGDEKSHRACESSAVIAQRVNAAWQIQLKRQAKPNAYLGIAELEDICRLSKKDRQLLYTSIDRLNLSGRAMHRILRLSRTIADLEVQEDVSREHLLEAIGYRSLNQLNGY